MGMTGIVYDEIYLHHDTGHHHPEAPQRLTAIMETLEAAGLLDKLMHIEPVPAERSVLELCHEPSYIDSFKNAVDGGFPFLNTPECPISPLTYKAALYAVGGVLKGADAVMNGEVKNCFCAVRPPGHHAERSRAMGFCYLNNIAIAARYLQKQHGIDRILIVDWDVHHGNGTQHLLEKDPTIFYASFHQDPASCYPGTGWATEEGIDKGQGYTLNLPMSPGAGKKEYLEAMQKVEQEMDTFKPEFVLISAGFDAHLADPLAQIELTGTAYEELTRRIKSISEKYAKGRIVSALEGGYNLKALGKSVTSHIQVLMED